MVALDLPKVPPGVWLTPGAFDKSEDLRSMICTKRARFAHHLLNTPVGRVSHSCLAPPNL